MIIWSELQQLNSLRMGYLKPPNLFVLTPVHLSRFQGEQTRRPSTFMSVVHLKRDIKVKFNKSSSRTGRKSWTARELKKISYSLNPFLMNFMNRPQELMKNKLMHRTDLLGLNGDKNYVGLGRELCYGFG